MKEEIRAGKKWGHKKGPCFRPLYNVWLFYLFLMSGMVKAARVRIEKARSTDSVFMMGKK